MVLQESFREDSRFCARGADIHPGVEGAFGHVARDLWYTVQLVDDVHTPFFPIGPKRLYVRRGFNDITDVFALEGSFMRFMARWDRIYSGIYLETHYLLRWHLDVKEHWGKRS